MSAEPPAPPHPADTITPIPIADARPVVELSPFTPAGSESTKIEQSRAATEVLAMVEAAKRWPRTRAAAIARMEDACATMLVAEQAFYQYTRADGKVTGPSVHLMVELALCWQNMTHGHYELHRDPVNRRSELMAWAWDLESNYRVAQSFIVEWTRDTRAGGKQLTAQRDIYENNANMGARRMREAIRRVLPAWFVNAAVEACYKTLETGGAGGVPLDQRIAKVIATFDSIGVRLDQLEQHRERPTQEWTPYDLAQLHITYVSIHRREQTVDDAFPQQRVTGAEIAAQAAAGEPGTETPGPVEYEPDDPARPF